MRLRQVVIAAARLEPVVEELRAVLGAEVCFRDPGVAEFGLENALLRAGDTFVEVVSPTRPGTAAGRFLDRQGEGGYMVILETAQLDADLQRTASLGVRTVWGADLPDIRGRHLHPADVGAAILSLDQPAVAGDWAWAGPAWRDAPTPPGPGLVGVELAGPDPDGLAARWAGVLGVRPEEAGDGARRLGVDGGEIRVVVGVGPARLAAATLALDAPGGSGPVVVAGLRLDLVPAAAAAP